MRKHSPWLCGLRDIRLWRTFNDIDEGNKVRENPLRTQCNIILTAWGTLCRSDVM